MAGTIDAHLHLWHYDAQEYSWIGPEMSILQRDFLPADLAGEMHAAEVESFVAVQARQTMAETEWLLAVAEKTPAMLGVVGWAPLADAAFPAVLHRLSAHGKLKGLRHVIQDEPDDDFILGDDFNRGIDRLLDTGLVYDILIHERHLAQAARFVARHPQQIFVLDHLAKPLVRSGTMQPWRDNLLRLADHANVHCKLSGLVTEADWHAWTLDDLRPYLDTALEAFGAQRLMAGSDWPVCQLAASYKRWWDTLRTWGEGLPVTDREHIFAKTASRVYRLEAPSAS